MTVKYVHITVFTCLTQYTDQKVQTKTHQLSQNSTSTPISAALNSSQHLTLQNSLDSFV